MRLIDFDDTEKLERLADTADQGMAPLPGSHPVVVEVYRVIGTDDSLQLVRGEKKYRLVTSEGPGPWTDLTLS